MIRAAARIVRACLAVLLALGGFAIAGAGLAGAAAADPLDAAPPTSSSTGASSASSPNTTSPNTTSPSATGSTAPGASSSASAVRVDLVSIDPRTPDAAVNSQPVVVTAVLRNTGTSTYTGLRVDIERGAAIVQRPLLHQAIQSPPGTSQWSTDYQDAPAPLAPGAQQTVTFSTTPADLCMCFTGDFPYDLVVEGSTGDGYREVGRTAFLLPSFLAEPSAQLSLSWIWPLIDSPHQIGGSAVFADDDLAASVSAGGRLDRSLQVIEKVAPTVRMTVVIDPQLIDELQTMAAGYQVRTAAGDVPGTGSGAAAAWLARLKAVAPTQDVVLTPYGDPDYTLDAAAGLPAPAPLTAADSARISAALGTGFRTDFAWPVDEEVSAAGLASTVAAGASSLLLSDSEFADSSTLPATAITSATAGSASAVAVALDGDLEDRVEEAVQRDQLRTIGSAPVTTTPGTQTSAVRIQALLAELALWPINGVDGYVALAPPRAVDPDPDAAAAAIVATASTPWAQIVPLAAATAGSTGDGGATGGGTGDASTPQLPEPEGRGALQTGSAASPSGALVAAIQRARSQIDAAASLVGPASAAVLDAARAQLAEAGSSAWRSNPDTGATWANGAGAAAAAITGAVQIATPDNASYSLSSENSPLILTVRNTLPYPVQVRLSVGRAPGAAAGFTAEDVGVIDLAADGTRTLHVPAHFQRSGRFQIQAQLATVAGQSLGPAVHLSVLCTAIGGVALWVTAAAFGLLVLLLLFRAVRGLGRRRAAKLRGVSAADQPDSPDGAAADPMRADAAVGERRVGPS